MGQGSIEREEKGNLFNKWYMKPSSESPMLTGTNILIRSTRLGTLYPSWVIAQPLAYLSLICKGLNFVI